jgi:hypothetical protein
MILGLIVSPFSAIILGVSTLFGSLLGLHEVWLKILKLKILKK